MRFNARFRGLLAASLLTAALMGLLISLFSLPVFFLWPVLLGVLAAATVCLMDGTRLSWLPAAAWMTACLLTVLVLLAIMFVINGISDYVQMDDEFAYVYSLRFDMDLSFLALHRAFPAFAVWFVSIVCTLLGVVLNVGASLYHLGIRRGEEMPFVTLFDGFAFVGKIILLYVVQVIFISLWTLLLVVPGIVAAYRYRFAMLNLCENPEIGVMEALNMSKAQTLGFKWQLFVLDLSFIGWNILVSLTLGILDIWVAPYRAQANIAFFQEIKKIKGVGFFPPRPEDDDQFRPHDPFGEDNW